MARPKPSLSLAVSWGEVGTRGVGRGPGSVSEGEFWTFLSLLQGCEGTEPGSEKGKWDRSNSRLDRPQVLSEALVAVAGD